MRKKAFTLIELLVVIAIIALLLSIVMPALRRAKEKTKEVVCASQIRQQCIALLMYAQANEEKMPKMTMAGGEWLWDVSYSTTDLIIASGADRKIFHCPSNRIDTNTINYWRYSEYSFSGLVSSSTPEPSDIHQRQQEWRVLSYSYLTETENGRGDIWAPSDPDAPKVRSTQKEFISKATQRGQRELIIDSVIAYPNDVDKWIIPNIYLDWALGTNHMGRKGDPIEPSGGNIGFLDGHVTWRHFKDMYERYGIQGVIFWW
jgi:prepilin-type N-terminal cleavage/methylation domain-containing protein/prepilin-type processing-associated H-X9-DG protein